MDNSNNGACEVSGDLLDAALDEPEAESPDLETMGCGQTQGPYSQGPGPYQQPAGNGGQVRSLAQQLQPIIGIIAALMLIAGVIVNWSNGSGAKEQRVNDRLGALETDTKEIHDMLKSLINAKLDNQTEQAPPGPRARSRVKVRVPAAANLMKQSPKDYGFADGRQGEAAPNR